MNNIFNKYNVKTPQELMKFFEDNMQYGFTYRNKVYTDLEPDFQENMDKFYKIRLGEDFIKSGYGVCWDFCELERKFFTENNIEHKCYFIESYINRKEGGPTHTFAIYKQNNKWYWFEYSWFYHRGIWEYSSIDEALQGILNKFDEFYNKKLINIGLYETEKVSKRLNVFEFVEHCLNGKKISGDLQTNENIKGQ